jgi:hypothetical protein
LNAVTNRDCLIPPAVDPYPPPITMKVVIMNKNAKGQCVNDLTF